MITITYTEDGTAIRFIDSCDTTSDNNTFADPSIIWLDESIQYETRFEIPIQYFDWDDYKLEMILWNRKMAQQISIRPENWIMPKSPIEKRHRKNNRISFAKRMININPMIFLIVILMTII